MNNKKIIMYIIIILIILFILWMGILVINNKKSEKNKKITEYTPEAEITEEQLRNTNINLYFYNEEENKIEAEIRKIDAKKLIENPEKEIIEYLIEGPQNNNLKRIIPEKTQLIGVEKIGQNLIINFSEDFIKEQNLGKEMEENIIKSILETVTQLNEINGIKILINGEENRAFEDEKINFQEVFTR